MPDEESAKYLETKFALETTLWDSNATQDTYYYHRNR